MTFIIIKTFQFVRIASVFGPIQEFTPNNLGAFLRVSNMTRTRRERVASAVGDGAMSVQFVHEYLKQM